MNLVSHDIQELNIQLPLISNSNYQSKKLSFNEQSLIIKDCIKSLLYTITFHRALGEVYPVGMDCEVLDSISFPSIDEKELNQLILQQSQDIITKFQTCLCEEMKLGENFFTKSSSNIKGQKSANIIKLSESILARRFLIEIKYYTLKVSNSFSIFGGKREEKVYFETWRIPLKIHWNTQWNHLFEGMPLVKVDGKESEDNLPSKLMNNSNPSDTTKLQEDLRKRLVKIIKSAHEDVPHLPNVSDNLNVMNGKSFSFEVEVKSDSSKDDSKKPSGGWFSIW